MSRDIHTLSADDVYVCLQLLKMPEYADDLLHRDVDGEMLTSLDEAILVEELGFSRFNARKLLKFVYDGYRPRTSNS